MIYLPYGGSFDEHDLVAYIRSSDRDYIIQGQQAVSLTEHTKLKSLDYWLRKYGKNANTKQAENSVLDALVATGHFEVSKKLVCPDTGARCKGLRLI